MNRRICDYVITIYISLLLFYIVGSNIGRLYDLYSTKELSIGLLYFGVFGLIMYIFNKIINKVRFDIYDLLVFGLIFFGIISYVNAIRPEVALYGFKGRNEGLLQIISYYILFLNCKNMNNQNCKKTLMFVIIFLGIIQTGYAILQFKNIKQLFGYKIMEIGKYYSSGFETNSNFFGTVSIIGLSLSLSLYFINNRKYISILSLIASVILFLGLLCSGAMSVAVAFAFLILFLFLLFFILKLNWFKTILKLLIITICFLGSYKYFSLSDDGYYEFQIRKSVNEMGKTIVGDAKPIYGSGRIHIWTETLKIVPDNLWNGVGIDNLFYGFGTSILIDVKSGYGVDKAHNEYLQKLVTEGIFSIIFYLGLLLIIFINSVSKILRKKDKENYLLFALFLCFVSYCIQAFFNISVISVAPMFYIVMGLLCSLIKGDGDETIKN